jgi:hypothetical protein
MTVAERGQSQAGASSGRLGAITHAKFVKNAGDMHSNCAFTDEKGTRDLPVAVALRQQRQHVLLAAGEVEWGIAGGCRSGRRCRCLGPADQSGPPGQVRGQAEQRR